MSIRVRILKIVFPILALALISVNVIYYVTHNPSRLVSHAVAATKPAERITELVNFQYTENGIRASADAVYYDHETDTVIFKGNVRLTIDGENQIFRRHRP